MKKFVDKTKNGNEFSVKKISNLPKDNSSLGLKWFSSKEITPSSSIVITDVSSTIPENSNPELIQSQGSGGQLFFANELGILEDVSGNTVFNSDEISISDIFLSDKNIDMEYSLAQLNDKTFSHSYYVSKGYTLLEKHLYFSDDLSDFIEEDQLPKSIKVIDANGDEYTDKNTGIKKYRILLQPLGVSSIKRGTAVPYSVIVLLKEPNPIGLSLVYDKVTISGGDIISAVKLKDIESINQVSLFKKISEESIVADPTSRYKKIFAKKPSVSTANAVLSENTSSDGFQVFVPKKALSDNRTYETFNWRLIAKINSNVNTSSVNYGRELDTAGNIVDRRINCAVLCTSADLSNAVNSSTYSGLNPYVFLRLGRSSFNLSSYSYVNPLASASSNPNQAGYWLVNIDEVTDLNAYDIVAWSPTSAISSTQGIKIKSFIESKQGTVILDLSSSSLPSNAATTIYPYLSLSDSTTALSSWEYNTSNIFIDETKTNAWPINDSIFERIGNTAVYGIYGSSIDAASLSAKQYKYFTSSSITASNILMKEITSSSKPMFVTAEYRPTADALVRGNLLVTTAPIMQYCNNVYTSAGLYDASTSNSGATSIAETTVNPTAAIEGPMKIVYNAVSVATLSKIQSSRTLDIRSSKYYITGNWNSSYVVNGSVLLEQEKSNYTLMTDINSPNVRKYCRNLTSTYGSIIDYYKRICYDSIPDQYSILLQDIDISRIELFVEVTNANVLFANNNLVANNYLTGETNDIPSSYKLFKIQPTQYSSHLFAYTDSNSLPFTIPGGFGPHIIKEKPIQYSNSLMQERSTRSLTSSSFRSYPFNLSTYSSYISSTESSLGFNATWQANVIGTGTATYSKKTTVTVSTSTSIPDAVAYPVEGYSSVDVDDNEVIRDLPSQLRISTPKNNFFYSGDININKYNLQYGTDPEDRKEGEYVKYIQYTLAYSGISSIKGIKIDGIFGAQTKSFMSIFQKEKDEIYTEGGVDSETKSYLIRVWKDLYKNNIKAFNAAVAKIRKQDPEVIKYIEQHTNPEISELSTSDKSYKRISFSGSRKDGPKGTIRDTIYVRVPKEYNTQASPTTSEAKLTSITITPGDFEGSSSYAGIKVISIKAYKAKGNDKPDGSKFHNIHGDTLFFKNAREFKVKKLHSDYRWIGITIEGRSLGGIFGAKAEGYSIKEISFGMSYNQLPAPTPADIPLETFTKPFSVSFKITGTQNDINVNSPKTIDLSGRKVTNSTYSVSNILLSYTNDAGNSITDATITSIDFNSTRQNVFNTVSGVNTYETSVKFNYRDLVFTVSSPVVTSVTSSTGSLGSTSNISATVTNNSLKLSTSALNYQNGVYVNSTPAPISNYWMLKQDGSVVKNSKNTITVLDGLLLLCQPSETPGLIGKPVGVSPQSVSVIQSVNQEINIDYGSLILSNSISDTSGYIFGYYDNLRKEFLGSVITYLEYQNRGPNNIYIGILATDADGNMGTSIDFIGQRTATTINPVSIPMKAAYPIYSVMYKNSTKIRVNSIERKTSKFNQWPLYISSGSFVKDFYIDPSYGWTTFLQNYKKQTLRATYSTLSMKNIPWSKFLGRPYIDVMEEVPNIISSKKIQVSSTPIASINEPSYNDIGYIKSVVKVKVKDSVSDNVWKIIPTASIKNIDCNTGIIDFYDTIVPSDPSLINVDYTVVSNGIPLKQVNGNPIPLNPFLNKDIIESDKALYIYIKPTKIEYKTSNTSSYTWKLFEDYEYDTPINFTYDNSIFDPYDSVNFDPFALPIAVIHVVNNFKAKDITLEDMRIRGGGVKASDSTSNGIYGDLGINKLLKDIKESLSFWDIYPPLQHSYPKGGFIIIRLPKEVINNFENSEEIYSIIERNLTAGVAYKLQDMDGVDWGKA
jgi:hypothetical protein